MDRNYRFQGPETLVEGKKYFLVQNGNQAGSQFAPVTFVSYTSCPAVVVVMAGSKKQRCLRDELVGEKSDDRG